MSFFSGDDTGKRSQIAKVGAVTILIGATVAGISWLWAWISR